MDIRRTSLLFVAPLISAIAAGCGSGNDSTAHRGDGLHLTSGSGKTIAPKYGMTVFGGKGDCQSFSCGGGNSCSSQPYYVASSQRYACGVSLLITGPNGKSIVAKTADIGPASWVEKNAGTPVLDASPAVAKYLFGTDKIGAKDLKEHPGKYDVKVAPTSLPLGPVQQKAQADTGGSDGGTGNAYAFIERHHTDRHHELAIAVGASEIIGFEWHDAAGMAPPADLWLEVQGHLVVQVSSIAGRPFARVGLDLVPLEPQAPYDLVLVREGGLLSVSIENAAHDVVVTTEVATSDELQSVADVVLPSEPWRLSIASDRLD